MSQHSLLRLYVGSDVPAPPQRELTAGALRVLYGNGELRGLCWGEHEIVSRIYVALRDHNWRTIPGQINGEHIEAGLDGFTVTFDVVHRDGDIDFRWQGHIEGSAGGSLTFSMDGQAHSTFQRNRLGFCLLHPAAAAGDECRVEHADGTQESGRFPLRIDSRQPVPPFANMQALEQDVRHGLSAEFRFTGDLFEMEDQRNWTDASYKTFCTPLDRPRPVTVPAGADVTQSIELRIRSAQLPARARSRTSAVRLVLQEDRAALPALGLGCASHGAVLSPRDLERLRRLNLSHLRVELSEADGSGWQRLEQAAEEARTLGLGVEVAIGAGESNVDFLLAAAEHARRQGMPVQRFLLHSTEGPRRYGAPPAALLAQIGPHLRRLWPQARVAAGTNSDFIFLNKHRAASEHVDEICLAITPQGHAFDDASLVETLAMQEQVVGSARVLALQLPVVVSPVTLKPRFNAYASGAAPTADPSQLPPEVDPRQASLLGAGWTLGSLKYLSEGGAASVTFYETTGARGVMETEAGPALPELFPSLPGAEFPLFHVLADAGEFRGGQVVRVQSDESLAVEGLALVHGDRLRLMAANFGEAPRTVQWPGVRAARLRRLDATNALSAMNDPEAYRAAPGELVRARPAGELELELPAYGLATADVLMQE